MKTIDQCKVDKKRSIELKTVRRMIEIYCEGHHDVKRGELCEECRALVEYAEARVEHCPHMEQKTFCSMCKTHCYAPTYREQIRKVMRYSGPRMLWRSPIMTIRHLLLERGLLK